MEEEYSVPKGKKVGEFVLLMGLLLIAVGVGINFYNQMFVSEEVTNNDNNVEVTDIASIPTDMDAVSSKLNTDLGVFVAKFYDPESMSGVNLLETATGKFNLVKTVYTADPEAHVQDGTNVLYASVDEFTKKYEECFGNSEEANGVIAEGYPENDKSWVEANIGPDTVGWEKVANDTAVERTLVASDITYDEESEVYTITGVYTDSSLGSEIGNGTFTLTYGTTYIISFTLTKN